MREKHVLIGGVVFDNPLIFNCETNLVIFASFFYNSIVNIACNSKQKTTKTKKCSIRNVLKYRENNLIIMIRILGFIQGIYSNKM